MNDPRTWLLAMVPHLVLDAGLTVQQGERITTYLNCLCNADEGWVRTLAEEGTLFDQDLELAEPGKMTAVSSPKSKCVDLRVMLWQWIDESSTPERAAVLVRLARTIFVGLKKWTLGPERVPSGGGETSLSTKDPRHDKRNARTDLESACYDGFVRTQADLGSVRVGSVTASVRARMTELLAEVLRDYSSHEGDARMGPGSVSEGFDPLQKWGRLGSNVPKRLKQQFGAVTFVSGLNAMLEQELEDEPIQLAKETSSARLCAVPKDMWEFRIITIPALCYAWAQQYCRGKMLKCVNACHLTRHLRLEVGQEKHARLARQASCTGLDATLDFHDASNRVMWSLVTEVFPSDVVGDLGAARADEVIRPDTGAVCQLLSYDGMGNATTFIVETLLFWSCCVAVAEEVLSLLDDTTVHVYGDDVICNVLIVPRLQEVVTEFGWELNLTKSFFQKGGHFRESCGMHAWLGHDVTPLRFYGYDSSPEDRIAIATKIQELDGWPHLQQWLASTFRIPFAASAPTGAYACNISYAGQDQCPVRWNGGLHRLEVGCGSVLSLKCDWSGYSTWGHVLSGLTGYHLSTRTPLNQRARRYRARNDWYHPSIVLRCAPFLSAALPHRARLRAQTWFPTTSLGTSSPEEVINIVGRRWDAADRILNRDWYIGRRALLQS